MKTTLDQGFVGSSKNLFQNVVRGDESPVYVYKADLRRLEKRASAFFVSTEGVSRGFVIDSKVPGAIGMTHDFAVH